MKKTIVFLLIFSSLQLYIGEYLKITESVLSNIITFFSILFGFYITSFSIFATSQFVSSLYNIEDKNNTTQTLLHSLIQKYKIGLFINLFSIVYFIILSFLISQQPDLKFLPLNNLYTLLFSGLFIFTTYYSFIMLKDLLRVIIQEAKIKK